MGRASFRRAVRRLRYWLRHGERHERLQEEMEFHVDALARDLIEQGVAERDALSAARRRFGNFTRTSEESASTWISGWIRDGAQDLRHAFRTFRRDAGFTVFAVLIVGLGIGASSIIFSFVGALLLRPLPFRDAKALVWIANKDVDAEGLSGETVPVFHFLDLRDHSQSFSDVAAYSPFYAVGDNKLTREGEPQRLTGVSVSYNFFSVLGIKPFLGRPFHADDCQSRWNEPKGCPAELSPVAAAFRFRYWNCWPRAYAE